MVSLPWNASDGFGLFHVLFAPDVNHEVRGSCIGKVKEIAEYDPESENMIREMSKFMGLLPAASDIPGPPTPKSSSTSLRLLMICMDLIETLIFTV
jgi:hypothetical protein